MLLSGRSLNVSVRIPEAGAITRDRWPPRESGRTSAMDTRGVAKTELSFYYLPRFNLRHLLTNVSLRQCDWYVVCTPPWSKALRRRTVSVLNERKTNANLICSI